MEKSYRLFVNGMKVIHVQVGLQNCIIPTSHFKRIWHQRYNTVFKVFTRKGECWIKMGSLSLSAYQGQIQFLIAEKRLTYWLR